MSTERVPESYLSGLMYGERREALLRAVVTVVARDGLRSLTYRRLAKQAGVSHGLIAHHFGSIDNLLGPALELSIEDTVAGLELIPPSSDVDDFAADLLTGIVPQAENLTFQYEVMLEGRQAVGMSGIVKHLNDRYRGIVATALRKMRVAHDDGMVELVYAALEGIVFHQLVHEESDANERALERLRSLLRASRCELDAV